MNEILIKQLIEQMNTRFDKLDQNYDILDQNYDKLNQKFDNLHQNLEDLKQQMNNYQIENRSYFKHIESKLDVNQRTFQVVSDELGRIKIDINHLSEKAGKHDTEINNINKHIQS